MGEIIKIDKEKLKSKIRENEYRLKKNNFIILPCLFSTIGFALTIIGGQFDIIPGNWKYFLLVIPLLMLITGIYESINNSKRYTANELFDDVCKCSVADEKEHAFHIIVIKNPNIAGELLLREKVEWDCFLFPDYKVLSKDFDKEKERTYLINKIKNDIGISEGVMKIEYIKENISTKYSVNDQVEKVYHFYYWSVSVDRNVVIGNNSILFKKFKYGTYKYKWMAIDDILKDSEMLVKNKDVIDQVKSIP